jgi:glycosyltransferase involved in cell wall biosynthesis
MKKILVDCHVFDGMYQGTVTYIKGLYFSVSGNKDLRITLAARNVENLRVIFGEKFDYIRLKCKNKVMRLLFEYPLILFSRRFDFAHFQYIVPPLRPRRTKVINTIHDIIPVDFKRYYSFWFRLEVMLLFRISAYLSDILLTVSLYSKRRIASCFSINKKKIYVIPNGVDGNTAVSRKIWRRDCFLYVSRIEERKNHITLVRAFFDGGFQKNFDLIFIGKPVSENRELKQFIQRLDEEKKKAIVFLENVSNSNLLQFYSGAALFVFPSVAEGFGIPPLEAAMCGCKVVCSNSTAMGEFDFFRYSFDPENTEELRRKMGEALLDTEYDYAYIKQEILRRYSWSVAGERFAGVLQNEKWFA